MELHVGCPMWQSPPWQDRYLPRGLGPRERLRAYATWCNAVEGNTTFYATPSLDTVRSWAGQTDPGFRFVLKLPRPVTHEQHLDGDVAGPMRAFLAATDLGTLAGFMRRLPDRYRYAVEVRHRAFFADPRWEHELERVLDAAGAEWVPFDTTVLFGKQRVTGDE